MTLGSIFFLIGMICLVINIWYMANSKDYSNMDTETKQMVACVAVLIAPVITLLYLLITMNSLVVKGRK